MQKIAFISPHPDDVVFSCSDHILKWKQSFDITIISVFTDYKTSVLTPELKNYLKRSQCDTLSEFSHQRREEDQKAVAALGVSYKSLGLTDAAFRHTHKKLHYQFSELFSGKMSSKDFEIISILQKKLAEVCSEYDALICPLGLGKHIDHLLVHNLMSLMFKDKCAFYLDFPYFTKATNWSLNQFLQVTEQKKSLQKRSSEKLKYAQYYTSQYPLIFTKNMINLPIPELIVIPSQLETLFY